MSTKSTIDYRDDWHLYTEALDDDVYIHLEDSPTFVARHGEVTVHLPPAVLDAIAKAHDGNKFPHQQERKSEQGEAAKRKLDEFQIQVRRLLQTIRFSSNPDEIARAEKEIDQLFETEKT